jgi:hypothetical protein
MIDEVDRILYVFFLSVFQFHVWQATALLLHIKN